MASPAFTPNTGLSLASFSADESAPQVVVAVQAQERRDQVVEEAAVVGRRHVAVAGRGQLVLVDPLDAHLLGGDRLVLAHRQAGTRLAVHRDLDAEAGGQFADQFQPVDVGLGAAQPEQGVAQVIAQRDRRIGGGVDPAGGGGLVATGGDAVGGGDGRLQPGPTCLLQVEGRGIGRQRGAEHAFAHQVEVAAVLEHCAADHGAQSFTGQVEPVDQAAQGGGEHVLVGRLGVGAVRARKRDPVAAQHDDTSFGGGRLGTRRGAFSNHAYLRQLLVIRC